MDSSSPSSSIMHPSWTPHHLLQPAAHGHQHQQHQHHSPFSSPTTTTVPSTSFPDNAYYHQAPPPSSSGSSVPRSSSGLSLNMSSLSVTSSVPSTTGALSPVTPLSPANMTPQQGGFAQQQPIQPTTFRFAPPEIAHYDQQQSSYDSVNVRRPPGSSRSTSSSEKSVPRKRSLTTSSMPLSVSVEEDINFDSNDLNTPGSHDDSDMYYGVDSVEGVECSPVDGSPSSGEHHDEFRIIESHLGPPTANGAQPGSSFTVLGKTVNSNNFVAKLYQMISDSKSSHFISWTELGTSFIVTNVGEFSRSILGSHFKHNNFSSFVRQLNMYGFHKINRTPRAQRTSTDAQTWEFLHPKFLRGRTDLLDDIKRKSLEQDISGVRHRVELPAEVTIQLNRLSEDHRRTVKALAAERQKVERLTGVVKVMYDMMANVYPGQMPIPFPTDLLDSSENPPILITSHSHSDSQSSSQRRHSPSSSSAHPSRYNATLNAAGVPVHANISPCSSPTAPDFSQQYQNTPALPHSHYDPDPHPQHTQTQPHASVPSHTPSPDNSNGVGDGEHGPNPKRQRTATGQPHHDRKLSRARSDSAPLGYGFGHAHHPYAPVAPLGRPRSGSNLVGVGAGAGAGGGSGLGLRTGRREDGFLGLGTGPGARMSSTGGTGAPSFSISGLGVKDEPVHPPS